MDKGIYCLVLENPEVVVGVGALGEILFPSGWHVYAGSALGPGGLSRVIRHFRCSRGRGSGPRWHIDYLLRDPSFSLTHACACRTAEQAECRLAQALGGEPVPRFGSSDCACPSHLFRFRSSPNPAIRKAFRLLGLGPVITMLNTDEYQS